MFGPGLTGRSFGIKSGALPPRSLLVRGEFSEVVPRESAELMVEMLQDASWAEVPGCGHAPTLYEPEAQAALRKFFGVNGT